MCGIAGLIAPNADAVREALSAMNAAMTHRGPDDGGEHVLPFGEHWFGVAHRRLAIIDLSPAGHQPMVHPVTGDLLNYNGEIYNFAVLRRELAAAGETFAGRCDSEVLLRALTHYGPSVIGRLQGMFAFVFYNRRENTVLLARDALGIKPLYVARIDGGLVFGSEVRAVLASGLVPREIDPQAVGGVLAYGCPQQPLTIVRGVRSFPAGCYQEFAPAGARPAVRYWDFPQAGAELDEGEAVERVRTTVSAAVRDHLVSDVPLGVFLSSGLDSTIVAAVAAEHAPRLRSFTVGFGDHADMSEAPLAAETARLFGLAHTEILLDSADAQRSAADWLGALDQPSFDGLNVYVISRAVRAEGITVALSGQGGDELFGGYPSFRDVPRLQRLMHGAAWLPRPVRRGIGGGLMVARPRAMRDKLADMLGTDGSVLELFLQRRRVMSGRQLRELQFDPAEHGLSENCQPPEALAELHADDDVVRTLSRLESRFYQNNMLLRDCDANGMAHSLEIRVPLLDQRLLDLVYPMPGRLRLPPGAPGKYLLRQAFADKLRPALAAQAKRGFSLPIRRWMQTSLRELCEQSLRALEDTAVLGTEGIRSVWRGFLAEPESPIWSRAFTLCVLGAYCRRLNQNGR